MRVKPNVKSVFKRVPKGFCNWCGGPIVVNGKIATRRSWHRESCLDEYLTISDPAYCARKTFERDMGICQCCKLDVGAAVRERSKQWSLSKAGMAEAYTELEQLRYRLILHGFTEKEFHDPTCHLWECDHIMPVWMAKDGDINFFKLTNTQVLCNPCHKVKSRFDTNAARQCRRNGRELNEEFKSQYVLECAQVMAIRRRE